MRLVCCRVSEAKFVPDPHYICFSLHQASLAHLGAY